MVNTKTPECVHCFGRNWTKVALLKEATTTERNGNIIEVDPAVYLWQCGHGLPHADPSEMKSGCGRVIAATEEEMNAGGSI